MALGLLFVCVPLALGQLVDDSLGKFGSQNETTVNRCRRLLASHNLDALALQEPEARRPAESVVKKITTERVCERSYHFKGGNEKILTATPEEVREDATRFRQLFKYYDGLTQADKDRLKNIPEANDSNKLVVLSGVLAFNDSHKDLDFYDVLRLEELSKGASREQITLFGRLLEIQSLRLHGRFQEANQMFQQMKSVSLQGKTLFQQRKAGLQIQDHKLDFGDDNTYFSPQTLRNLIAVNGYAAAGEVPGTLESDGTLIADYLDKREALVRLFGVEWPAIKSPDPDSILKKLSNPANIGLNTAQWDTQHRLSHVVGSFKEGDDTIVFIRGVAGLHAVELSSDKEPKVIDTDRVADKLQAFYQREVRENSTSDMKLFTVLGFDDGTHDLQWGDQLLTISSEEFKSLQAGHPLPPTHPLTVSLTNNDAAKVLYANPMMQYTGEALSNADAFVFALQKSYPDVPIYRDPFSSDTHEKVKALRAFTISGPSAITAIVASETFRPKVDDFGAVKAIEANLKQAGVAVVEFKDNESFQWTNSKGRALIVITAHSNDALRVFVEKLGEAGVFEGNFVLFNSCGTELSRSLVNEMNSRFKSAATFALSGTILPQTLQASMSELAGNLNGTDKIEFGKLLIKTFNSHDLEGVWTISEVFGDSRGSICSDRGRVSSNSSGCWDGIQFAH